MSPSSKARVISSGVTAATVGKMDCAMAAVTRPAPARNAATELIQGAPDLPLAPPITRTWPKRPLLESAERGRSAIALEVPAQVRPVAGLDCFCRGTDGRHHDGSLLMIAGKRGAAGEHSGNMGQLGRGEGNHGIGAIGVGREELARVRIPARRQIHRDHGGLWIAFEQVAAGDRQATHGGTKTGAQDGIDKELSTLQERLCIGHGRGRLLPR